ncbi:MAG TPA: hypothetical protein VIL57_05175 [Bacteroidia bacterium]
MTNKLIKYIATGAMALIGVVGGLFCLLIMVGGPDTSGMTDAEKFPYQLQELSAYLDAVLYIAQFAILLALAIIFVYFIIGLIQRPKNAIGSIVGIGGTALIILISWFLADDFVNWGDLTPDKVAALNEEFTSGQRKFSGANVWAITIFLGLTILTIAGMEAYRLFRSRK